MSSSTIIHGASCFLASMTGRGACGASSSFCAAGERGTACCAAGARSARRAASTNLASPRLSGQGRSALRADRLRREGPAFGLPSSNSTRSPPSGRAPSGAPPSRSRCPGPSTCDVGVGDVGREAPRDILYLLHHAEQPPGPEIGSAPGEHQGRHARAKEGRAHAQLTNRGAAGRVLRAPPLRPLLPTSRLVGESEPCHRPGDSSSGAR